MGLMIEREQAFEQYEAVALPPTGDLLAGALGAAVFLRRSARPSRRAVLHLHNLTSSFAPADLARWYNERGFHFYVTDLDLAEMGAATQLRKSRTARACFATLDSACRHLRDVDGIDAIILSADEEAAAPAALWCHARRAAGPVAALILSNPNFGRGMKGNLDIACPVLVISAASQQGIGPGGGRAARANGAVRLGQHVTWLHLDEPGTGRPLDVPGRDAADAGSNQRQLFDEMGRWLGAYMYGKARDQLL
jgi:alpha-beta hydrolase superfamily lysophospholipase